MQVRVFTADVSDRNSGQREANKLEEMVNEILQSNPNATVEWLQSTGGGASAASSGSTFMGANEVRYSAFCTTLTAIVRLP